MSRSPTSVHTNSEMESEINRLHNFCAENNTISMLANQIVLLLYTIRAYHVLFNILYVERYIYAYRKKSAR